MPIEMCFGKCLLKCVLGNLDRNLFREMSIEMSEQKTCKHSNCSAIVLQTKKVISYKSMVLSGLSIDVVFWGYYTFVRMAHCPKLAFGDT